jgi:succinate dehydrogenase / fumarate reductase flavoprotein subunit
MILDGKAPKGDIEEAWDKHRFSIKVVNPSNKRKFKIIVVGTGLAGASAAASMAEMGYQVETFCYQDSPRRAHSIAAQGGINAAKNYQNDGDSIFRLFYDTVKGGDFRSRERNVYRLAQVSNSIIDQAVAQGVPFAREYSGLLGNRSFGGAQVSRTFYAAGQTGQQLLLGAYQALARQIGLKNVVHHNRTEMQDLILVDGQARGIVTRNLITGQVESHMADAVVLATGGYGNVYYLSTNAMGCNVTAGFQAYKRGAYFANPCYVQIHPTCIPVHGEFQSKLTLMSESLRNDGRVWVPRNKEDVEKPARDIAEPDRYYYLEERYPAFGNLVPRDVAARNSKYVCDDGLGVGHKVNGERRAVYLDFADAIKRDGEDAIREKYGNLFHMYSKITGENPYKVPMRIYPAVHYTMGGLWVDYNLMSNVPGLHVIGEANFSDHGANRLGASALMQGLADGYFVLPYTIGNFLWSERPKPVTNDCAEAKQAVADVKGRINTLMDIKGNKPVDYFHRQLGKVMYDKVGISRTGAGLKEALEQIPAIREEFWKNVSVPGKANSLNPALEKAGRVADFLEFAEVLAHDAHDRDESAGGHFREEHQTEEGEAKRNDEDFSYVAAWGYQGVGVKPELHKEPLSFDYVKLSQRSYK